MDGERSYDDPLPTKLHVGRPFDFDKLEDFFKQGKVPGAFKGPGKIPMGAVKGQTVTTPKAHTKWFTIMRSICFKLKAIDWRTFVAGVACGMLLWIGVFYLCVRPARNGRFIVLHTIGHYAVKMDTRTGQTWEVDTGDGTETPIQPKK